MRLAKPDYFDAEGRRVFCKGCGAQIAGLKTRGRAVTYEQFPNYRELKILFDDRSMHVTNVCATCLPKVDSPRTLDKLALADLHYMEQEVPSIRALIRDRRALRVIAATNRPVALP